MTLPIHPNSISAYQIRTEFGATSGNPNTGPVRLGAYRISQTVAGLSDLPLDTGVPQGTSTIRFGNLRGTKLNVVVDCTPASGQWRSKVNAREDYNDATKVTVIGGFKTKPPSPANTKVIIHNNGNIGSYVYLSRGRADIYCTYDVIVGNEECYPQTDGDGNYITDGDGNVVYYCPPIYEQRTELYGYLRFYASPSEIKSAGYTLESKYYIRMFPSQEPGTTALYRLYNPNNLDHLYTIDVNEWNNSGYNQEYEVGYVYGYAAPSTNPVYRGYKVYNPPSGNCATLIDRLYTFDVNELYNNGFSVEYNGNPAFYAPAFVSEDSKGSRNSCSLLTGSWDAATELIVDIGPSARIYGAGGDGGKGGNQGGAGNGGGPGTSGIGVNVTGNTTIRIASGAIVRGGGGGGGGGGGAIGNSVSRGKGFVTNAGGGGGGGGQGYPGGNGGDLGVGSDPGTKHKAWGSGTAGGAGSLDTAGNAGNGGAGTLGSGCQAFGGGGGGGGFAGGAGSGTSSEGNYSEGGSAGTTAKGGDGGYGQGISSKGYSSYTCGAGTGGDSGHGIVVDTSRSNVTVSNNGTVSSFVYRTTPS
jgi:hypothetical protein